MLTFKDIRQVSGLTQREFAIKYEIPLNTIKSWECTDTSNRHRECPAYVLKLLERVIYEDYGKKK